MIYSYPRATIDKLPVDNVKSIGYRIYIYMNPITVDDFSLFSKCISESFARDVLCIRKFELKIHLHIMFR